MKTMANIIWDILSVVVVINKKKENKKLKTTKIKIKKLNDLAIIPERGSEYSAGMDLHAAISEPTYISPHETIKIPTGLAMELPEGTFGAIFARSGLATKEGLAPATKVSVIDSDYRGEIGVPLHNDSNMSRLINPGERIAQLVLLPYVPIEFKEVDKLSYTDRGFGGFGSTGK